LLCWCWSLPRRWLLHLGAVARRPRESRVPKNAVLRRVTGLFSSTAASTVPRMSQKFVHPIECTACSAPRPGPRAISPAIFSMLAAWPALSRFRVRGGRETRYCLTTHQGFITYSLGPGRHSPSVTTARRAVSETVWIDQSVAPSSAVGKQPEGTSISVEALNRASIIAKMEPCLTAHPQIRAVATEHLTTHILLRRHDLNIQDVRQGVR